MRVAGLGPAAEAEFPRHACCSALRPGCEPRACLAPLQAPESFAPLLRSKRELPEFELDLINRTAGCQ